jgi:alkanesulfonate monooxygenase SsuD/methylene tetrahydromethanopterin reductase-like flavin-dependent oxidoreductase (luciferase family)
MLPMGASWEATARFASRAEAVGFDSLWAVDHFSGILPGTGILEGWTLMSAVAAITTRIDIGALVLCHSFRPPGLLAKMVTTLDEVAGGRVRVLLGAGYRRDEYEQFGYEFAPASRRLEELEEVIRICRGIWESGAAPFSFEGAHYSLSGATNLPPATRVPPIGVGGSGDKLLGLVARVGDEWNCPLDAVDRFDERSARLDELLESTQRTVRRSIGLAYVPEVGALGVPVDSLSGDLRRIVESPGLRGGPDELPAQVARYAACGVDALYVHVLDDGCFEDLAGALPALRAAALEAR